MAMYKVYNTYACSCHRYRITVASIILFLLTSNYVIITNYLTTFSSKESISCDETKEVSASESSYKGYIPSSIETYIIDHAVELGYASEQNPPGCTIWKYPNATNPDIHKQLQNYMKDLDSHAQTINSFKPIPDLLTDIITTGNHDVCAKARPHPNSLKALFPGNQLSLSKSGYVEPLTTPMRSPSVCFDRAALMKMDYLVHDFEAMCRMLKPTSKRVLIDMGASLSFHRAQINPIAELIELYEKFGFNFDHIYGFEVSFTDPKEVYGNLLPEKYLLNYHWINVGVNETEGAKLNPLHSILEKFNEDDFIVVKLDVDTPSVELPLAHQLLQGGKDGIYHKLVDQFYFEHHVHLEELSPYWKRTMHGTVKDSLDLFFALRKKGISAHFWV